MAYEMYRIRNVAYPGEEADLINGNPVGPVQGYHINDGSTNMLWRLTIVSNTPPKPLEVVLNNVRTNTIARVENQVAGVAVYGGPAGTDWLLVQRDLGQIQITTTDQKLAWTLGGGSDFDSITLQPTDPNNKAQRWLFIYQTRSLSDA